jgi:hypothetical protein
MAKSAPTCRTSLRLQHDWFASISPRDAALAARGRRYDPAKLDCVGDPENRPQRLALPGGPNVGLRPLTGGELPPRNPAGQRLPNPFLTYARRLRIPAAWAGRRLHLELDDARYHVTVTLDGRRVARYVGGLEPHLFDVTDYLTPGTTAILAITVGDSGTSGHRRFDPYLYTGTRLPTCKEIENNLTHPVVYGGANRGVGFVTLRALPAIRTDHVFADPKVAAGELHYTVALANDTDQPATVRVQSLAGQDKVLVDETVTLRPRAVTRLRRVIPWPDARRWDTDDPYLYRLTTRLTAGKRTLDEHRDYFGFREFTRRGPDLLLNGTPIHLFGQSGHTTADKDEALSLRDMMATLRLWKEQGNVNHVRLHAKPQHPRWVEAADRVGMLITTETALWTTGFHSFDWVGSEEACYRNVRHHALSALVRRDRNRPSVVIWSLSNEMSPIIPADLENPKMAALTRVLERVLADMRREDSSRLIQMSSAVDFLGRLEVYNLHYPKSWQAFPDYPHTAYWLDGSFLFPWYGPRRHEMAPWSWRRDKPLIFGEFTCVHGATPDNQASIVGDAAFEQPDFGTALVNEKLWPMEIQSYRRLGVSGFTAWACFTFDGPAEARAALAKPAVAAHTHALRPLAVLDHSWRTRYLAGDVIERPLSVHNDTRHELPLALTVILADGDRPLALDSWPERPYDPAEYLTATSRFRVPPVTRETTLTLRAVLRSGDRVVDQWERALAVAPRQADLAWPTDSAVYDPDGVLAARFAACGITGATFITELTSATLAKVRQLWLSVPLAKLQQRQWQAARPLLEQFVREGGCVVLDDPTDGMLAELPVPLTNGKGYAPGDRLEITYAYNVAPHHPALSSVSDHQLSLWGADHYLARRCFGVPQEGNVRPLLVAGTDRAGLTASPLLELRQGAGSWLVSSLLLFAKLDEEPLAAGLAARFAGYRPTPLAEAAVVATGSADCRRRLREVGYAGAWARPADALAGPVALLATEELSPELLGALPAALARGATVCLHGLTPETVSAVLRKLKLTSEVSDSTPKAGDWDCVRHSHSLATGLTSGYLYWIVNKAKVAPWTLAPLLPRPATAAVAVPAGLGATLTRRGALVVYPVGPGTLVLDLVRWEATDLDEPERPRRYLMTLLTNLGFPLTLGAAKSCSEDHETEAERRERGHF